jgi:hypothetical protein
VRRRLLLAAAALAALPAAAQDISRWGPVSEGLGVGGAICTQEDPIVCAVVLCREGALSLGLMGVEYEDMPPSLEVGVEVDGEMFRRELRGSELGGDVLYIGGPVSADEPIWGRLRAGRSVRFHDRDGEEAREFSLRGSADELDRIARACR